FILDWWNSGAGGRNRTDTPFGTGFSRESCLAQASALLRISHFRTRSSASPRPYAAPSGQQTPADVYATARKCRRAVRGGFRYRHLLFSIASATKEIENAEDRSSPNQANNPAPPIARDGA